MLVKTRTKEGEMIKGGGIDVIISLQGEMNRA